MSTNPASVYGPVAEREYANPPRHCDCGAVRPRISEESTP